MNQDQVILAGSILVLAVMMAIWLLRRPKPQRPTPKRLHFSVDIFLLVFAMICGVALAQAPPASGDYTAALPSVEKVKAQLKGTDPTDTIARQVAVFTYLQTYITRIRDARKYNGPFTPGEEKLMRDYALAGYQLSQDFTKTHSPEEVKAFQQVEGKYEIMNALDWIKQLQGQQAADTYRGAEANLADSYKQHEERLQQQMKKDQGNGRSSIAGDPVLDPMGIFAGAEANREKDPELRRCLELGGTLDACEGIGAMEGMASLRCLRRKADPNEAPCRRRRSHRQLSQQITAPQPQLRQWLCNLTGLRIPRCRRPRLHSSKIR